MMRKAESQWLHSSGEVRKEMQLAYLDRKKVYSKAIRRDMRNNCVINWRKTLGIAHSGRRQEE